MDASRTDTDTRPANHGIRWTESEITSMMSSLKEAKPVSQVALDLGRSEGSVFCKAASEILKLGPNVEENTSIYKLDLEEVLKYQADQLERQKARRDRAALVRDVKKEVVAGASLDSILSQFDSQDSEQITQIYNSQVESLQKRSENKTRKDAARKNGTRKNENRRKPGPKVYKKVRDSDPLYDIRKNIKFLGNVFRQNGGWDFTHARSLVVQLSHSILALEGPTD